MYRWFMVFADMFNTEEDRMRRFIVSLFVLILAAAPAVALHPGTEIVVPAAGRGNGAGGSLWITSLYVLNPNADAVDVSFGWLVRDRPNPNPQTVVRTIPAGEAMILDDAILELFGMQSGGGAFLVTAPEPIVVNAGIFNRAGGEEFGQGFEGMPTTVAISEGQITHSIGIADNAEYRTNFFVADVSGEGSLVSVEVVDASGAVLGGASYQLGAYEPILKGVGDLVSSGVDAGMIRFTVDSGKAFVGASRVNEGTGDPLTLAAWWECGGSASSGLAPEFLAGLELDMTVTPNECGMESFTESVRISIVSNDEAIITIGSGSPMTIPIETYMPGGDVGYIETSLPDWQITNVWLNMIWNSSAGGRFTGAATDYDGSPIQFSGTFSVTSK